MTYNLAGKEEPIGGYKSTGKLLPIGHPDPRVPTHILAQQRNGPLAEENEEEGAGNGAEHDLKLDIGSGVGGKVLPAAATLVKEESALRATARRIEKVRASGGRERVRGGE